jgi:hypothetical protein
MEIKILHSSANHETKNTALGAGCLSAGEARAEASSRD